MNFKDAYKAMTDGKKIKRSYFKGYWYARKLSNNEIVINIHLASGFELYNVSNDLALTLSNVVEDDWEVIE